MLGICLDTNIRISIFLSMSLPSKSSQIGFRPPPRVAIVGPKGWLCELLALKAGEKVHSKVLQVSDPAFFCRFCSFNLSLAWNELGYHNKCHSTTSDSVIDEEFVGLINLCMWIDEAECASQLAMRIGAVFVSSKQLLKESQAQHNLADLWRSFASFTWKKLRSQCIDIYDLHLMNEC